MFPTSTETAARVGGRDGAPRLFVAAALMVFNAIATPATADARGQAESRVTVTENAGLYTVAATFTVAAPESVVIAALTDYAEIPRFMPEVQTSQVLARGEGHAVVEQEAITKFMMFSKRVHLVLDVQVEPGAIRFRDRCGKSFSRYDGAWTIAKTDSATVVTYQLSADPRFDIPDFLIKRLLKRDSTQMIERLKAEVDARSRRE